jgi:glutathione S-transferase
MVPIFYSFRRCPYAMRARLALDASTQRCELREVRLRNKPEAMLEASAKGTVPVLIDTDGAVIDESLEIMLWALHRNDPERWLPTEPDSFEATQELIRYFDTHFKQHLDRYKYPNRFEGASAELSRAEASDDLHTLEVRLQRAAYLCGDRPTLADMAIAPFVRQFANVDGAWFATQPWPSVQRWLSAFVSSSRFERIMQPIEPWVPGTSGVSFPFAK